MAKAASLYRKEFIVYEFLLYFEEMDPISFL